MPHYQLDDPNLQTALDDLAARDTADWPAPAPEDKATIARIFNGQARPAVRATTTAAPARRAA